MATQPFFQEITIAGKSYSSLDDLIQLKGELEQKLQQKRIEAGEDVDQTLRSIAGYNQRDQELNSHLMNSEALLKRAQDTSAFLVEQRTVLNTGITDAKAAVDCAAKVVVELKTKLNEAEIVLRSKQGSLQVAQDQQRNNEDKISKARPELLRLEKVKDVAAKDLLRIRMDKATYTRNLNPAKEEWRQLDANLKLVTLLVATAPSSPPPAAVTVEKKEPVAEKEQPVPTQEKEEGGEKEHKKKKHRPAVEQ